ncbi:MAG: NosD domain-containing protein, partial [Thermoanaerobaculia bacterium]
GILLDNSSGNTLKKNTATGNGTDGLNLTDADDNTLKRNEACVNQGFDANQDGASTGNVFDENTFCRTNGL